MAGDCETKIELQLKSRLIKIWQAYCCTTHGIWNRDELCRAAIAGYGP